MLLYILFISTISYNIMNIKGEGMLIVIEAHINELKLQLVVSEMFDYSGC